MSLGTLITSFFDGFGPAGLFMSLERPDGPTQVFADEDAALNLDALLPPWKLTPSSLFSKKSTEIARNGPDEYLSSMVATIRDEKLPEDHPSSGLVALLSLDSMDKRYPGFFGSPEAVADYRYRLIAERQGFSNAHLSKVS